MLVVLRERLENHGVHCPEHDVEDGDVSHVSGAAEV